MSSQDKHFIAFNPDNTNWARVEHLDDVPKDYTIVWAVPFLLTVDSANYKVGNQHPLVDDCKLIRCPRSLDSGRVSLAYLEAIEKRISYVIEHNVSTTTSVKRWKHRTDTGTNWEQILKHLKSANPKTEFRAVRVTKEILGYE